MALYSDKSSVKKLKNKEKNVIKRIFNLKKNSKKRLFIKLPYNHQ